MSDEIKDPQSSQDNSAENEETLEAAEATEATETVAAEVVEAEEDTEESGFEQHNLKIRATELGSEMRTSFLEYSMSVIVSRALPDVRDGLKPVHRRILYAMYESGNTPNKPHVKSARPVGDCMGKYHPHGDAAIYDTMVRLAQDFSMRVPLVDGHGNFGSIDGDSAAAMRYTEARLNKSAMELLRDLDKDTVDFQPNYDESLQEPKVLPARFPNLLVNGSNGIAVGMATNIPPHNLGEAIDAACMVLDNPNVTTEELMTVLPGPDFPTGGIIMGRKGIKEAYETGRGSLTIRAKCDIIEGKNGKSSIVVKEIPYQVNRKRLLEKLGELVHEKKLPEISNIHDAADRHGIDIIIELKQNTLPQVVLNKLYKQTQLQVGFGVIMLALVDGVPKVLSLKETLSHYVEHQRDVILRRTRYDLARAEERAHILEGLVIALDNIDEVIKIIRASETDKEAGDELMSRFGLSKRQCDAILEMKLRRLTGLEREKIEAELHELREKIDYYQRVLQDDSLVRSIIKEEMQDIKKRFNTPRRTEITGASKDIDIEDLVPDESVAITMTQTGYIKRMPVTLYRQQKRGGKGTQGANLKENDFVEHLFIATNHSYLLFFTSAGKVYRLKAYEIPEASRHARGTAIVNLLNLDKGETVQAVIDTKEFPEDEYLMFGTKDGIVKKTSMDQYDRSRKEGLIAINLREDDELISVKRVKEGDNIVMVSAAGKAISFPESEVRPMGRNTSGVRGMTVPDNTYVLGMEICKPEADLLVITDKGYGKRTALSEYPLHHRGAQGVFTITMTPKKGQLIAMKVVEPEEELMITTQEGVIVRTPVNGISQLGRAAQGVHIMDVSSNDAVTALALLAESSEDELEEDAGVDENAVAVTGVSEDASDVEVSEDTDGDVSAEESDV